VERPRRRRTPRVLVAVAFLLLVPPSAEAAADDAGATAASAAPDAAASLLGLGSRAELVATILRQVVDSLADEPVFDALEAELAAANRQVAERWTITDRTLAAPARHVALESIETSWHALRRHFEALQATIAARAQHRERDVATLARLHDTWSGSFEEAQKAGAPDAVVARAQATLAAIEATQAPVEKSRARILVLEDEASRGIQMCDDALDRVDVARRMYRERMLVDRDPSLWQQPLATAGTPAISLRIAPDIVAASEPADVYLNRCWPGLVALLAIFVALALLLRRGRERVVRDVAEDPRAVSRHLAFRTPWAAAAPIALLLSRPLRPDSPPILNQILIFLALLSAVRLLQSRISRRLAALLYAVTALYLTLFTTEILDVAPALRHALGTAQLGVAALLFLAMARELRRGGTAAARLPHVMRAAPVALVAAAVTCLLAAAAGIFGWLGFGAWLGTGILWTVVISIAVVAFRIAVDGLVALLLAHRPFAALRTVAVHRRAVDRAIDAFFDVAAVLIWLGFVLLRFDVLDDAAALAQAFLGARIQIGGLDLAWGRIFGFVAVVFAAYLVTRVTVFVLEEDVYSRMELPRGVPYALSTLTRYGLLLAGFLLALATLGLDLTRITVLVSAFGLGIGFGLQQIVNNFVSGLIVLFERPVQVGDSVQLGDLAGRVDRIGIRSSTIRTSDGAEVIVPNSKIIDDRVTNWTLSDRRRRVTIELTVAGSGDAREILALLVEAARREPRICAEPPPEALLVRFGEEQADFQLRVWTETPDWMRLRSDLGIEIQRALRERTPAAR